MRYGNRAVKYRKEMNQPLNFSECLHLLNECIKADLIQRDPLHESDKERQSNIMVYREASKDSPEGWYSQNIFSVAQELYADIDGQRALRRALENKGVDLTFTEMFPPKEEDKRIYIEK